jgi:hypothetical protein
MSVFSSLPGHTQISLLKNDVRYSLKKAELRQGSRLVSLSGRNIRGRSPLRNFLLPNAWQATLMM